jgi:Aspartyl protease
VFRIGSIILSLFVAVQAQAADLQYQVLLKSSSAQTYYIEGQFEGGKPSMFLLDTGSSYTVINAANLALLKRNGTVEYLKQLDGRLADGSQLAVPLYRVSTMTLDGHCVVRDIEVAVFPNADRQILGLSTLRKLSPILFMTDPPSLKLSNCTVAESRPPAKDQHQAENDLAMARPLAAEAASMEKTASDVSAADTGAKKVLHD